MNAVRVILITVAGPSGHVDIGVRSDATPADLADALGSVIGVSPAAAVIEHRSPPRPGVPEGARALVRSGTALAEAGVADGDLVLFRPAGGAGGYSWPEVQARPAEFGASSPPPDAPALSLSAPVAPAPSSPAPDAPALSLSAPVAPAPSSPAPDAPALSSPAPDAPAPSLPAPVLHALDSRPPDGPALDSPPADAPAFGSVTGSAPPAAAEPDVPDPWPPAEPAAPDLWPTTSEQTGTGVWAAAAPGAPDADPTAAITAPDLGQPARGERLVPAPRSSQAAVGRHARSRPVAAEPHSAPGQEITQEWPAVTWPAATEATQPTEATRPAVTWPAATEASQPTEATRPTEAADLTEAVEPGQPWRHDSQEVDADDWRG
jgi:hypothetical protein